MVLPISAGNPVPGSSATILFVDDEPIIRQMGDAVLRRHGYQVLLAADGLEALEIYKREGATIDLVILDLTMPQLSGAETLKRLLELDPSLRLLISSAGELDQVHALALPQVFGTIHKPYLIPELVGKVREALEHRRDRQLELHNSRLAEILPWAAQGG